MIDDQHERGQTQFDFLLGFSILIMAVMFAFLMAPGLLTPFSGSQAANPLLADRIADDLSESKLVDSPSTSTADDDAIDELFDKTDDDDLAAELGASEHRSVNVTLVAVESGTRVDHVGEPIPTDRGQVTVTRRILHYENETHWLEVRVW